MAIKKSKGEKVFDIFNHLFLALYCFVVTVPILHLVAGSFSSTRALTHGEVGLLPVDFNFDNYIIVFQNPLFWNSLKITLIVVITGTILHLFLTILAAYPLSKRDLKGRRLIMLFILFTLIFSAPMVPTYLVIKYLNLLNTIWALILPSAVSAFNLILCITFFRTVPEELFDAARVDGMSEYGIVWKIVVPLSKPVLVTLTLFYSVAAWNNYQSALLYITDRSLRPLQLYLYSLLSQGNVNHEMGGVDELLDISPQGLQMATIIVATIPIVLVYPFIQKHFIKGALLGSIKE